MRVAEGARSPGHGPIGIQREGAAGVLGGREDLVSLHGTEAGARSLRVLAELSSLGPGFVGLHVFPPGHIRPRRRWQKDVESPLQAGGAGWHLPMWAGLLFLMNNAVCTSADRNLRGCLWECTNPAGHKEGASL